MINEKRPQFVVSHPFEMSVLVAVLEGRSCIDDRMGIRDALLIQARRVQGELAEWDGANQRAGGIALND